MYDTNINDFIDENEIINIILNEEEFPVKNRKREARRQLAEQKKEANKTAFLRQYDNGARVVFVNDANEAEAVWKDWMATIHPEEGVTVCPGYTKIVVETHEIPEIRAGWRLHNQYDWDATEAHEKERKSARSVRLALAEADFSNPEVMTHEEELKACSDWLLTEEGRMTIKRAERYREERATIREERARHERVEAKSNRVFADAVLNKIRLEREACLQKLTIDILCGFDD